MTASGDIATRDWTIWSTDARLVLSGHDAHDPVRMTRASQLVDDLLAEVDAACSRFRSDSELARLHEALPTGASVTPMLAALVQAALDAALLTDDRVDPTLRYALDAIGYDRDIELIEDNGGLIRAVVSVRAGWRSVSLHNGVLRVPSHLALDMGATAKAVAADWAAARVHEELGGGVLLSLGGDIATAGVPPTEGWSITVRDLADDPAARITVTPGRALASSSTQKRRWNRAGLSQHHILAPTTGLPAEPVWKTATVAARTCVRANSFSTGAIVAGHEAASWLNGLGVAARLVGRDGSIVYTGDWPVDCEISPGDLARSAA
ncbi:FAD:protein FMN transferase [Microbacterium sp. NPDC076911]|uniref:FAD:protein FMN transferase n=1 Tax=Microbacterium sp. NPDC076911 TaxID=3154958 RepID=UPI003423E219